MPLIRISHETQTGEMSAVAADRVIAGHPRQASANLYSDAREQFHCGVWQAEPGTWRVSYSEYEFCHMLAGRIRIRDQSGGEWLVSAGDSFVITAGFEGDWEVLETARKIYAIFEPAATKEVGS